MKACGAVNPLIGIRRVDEMNEAVPLFYRATDDFIHLI